MRFIKLLWFIIFLAACSKGHENQVLLINDVFYEGLKSERKIAIDKIISDHFQNRIAHYNSTIPLFKSFRGHEYSIHVGLPVNVKFDRINNQLISERITSSEKGENYKYLAFEEAGYFYTETFIKIGNNTFFVLTETTSKEVHDHFFKPSQILKRIGNYEK